MKNWIRLLAFTVLLFKFSLSDAADSFDDPVEAEIIYEEQSIQPGHPFWVALRLKLEPGWHVYWKNPGEGMAPTVQWILPPGFKTESLQWPVPQKINSESLVYGYENELIFLTLIIPSTTVQNPVKIEADLSWVACDAGSCLPGETHLTSEHPVRPSTPEPHGEHTPLFLKARNLIPKKDLPIEACRKNGLITLQVKHPKEVLQAEFFSEQPGRINPSKKPLLSKTEQGIQIVLNEEGESPEPLKGILLLNDHEAFELNLPLVCPPPTEVALVEEGELEAQTPPSLPPLTDSHQFEGGLPVALILAFFGGLILNGMPCVLPVISFKILSFVKMANQSRSLIFKHGLAFSFGVLLSFWALAGALLLFQAWGQAVGWGFQLQEPLFVGILAAVIFVFGLSLFGVFELGTGMAALAGQAAVQTRTGLASSFFSGILATAVATPCTGPFLGTAVGFAVTLPTMQAMSVFSTLALGMASPYLLLGAFPELLRFMPKPGNWMVIFKEIMGFIMLATVLWLVWIFGAQTDTPAVFFLLSSFFLMSIGCWTLGKWGTPLKKKRTRLIGIGCCLICFVFGGYVLLQASSFDRFTEKKEIAMADEARGIAEWIPFSQEKLAQLRAQGIPVFVDFTAKWCLICQANHLVLDLDQVSGAFKEHKVIKMLADWTKRDPAITEELRKFGRNSVPLYVLYGADPEVQPTIFPQLLTQETVLEQLDKLK